MNILKKLITTILLISLGIAIAGCAPTGPRKAVLPEGGFTMSEIYHGQSMGYNDNSQLKTLRSKLPRPSYQTNREVRRPSSKIISTSSNDAPKTLPNPTIKIYVRPHYNNHDHVYVPGHTAYIKLYRQTHFMS